MWLGMVDWMGPGMRQVIGFGSKCEAPMGSLWHSCAKVCELSEVRFGCMGSAEALVAMQPVPK